MTVHELILGFIVGADDFGLRCKRTDDYKQVAAASSTTFQTAPCVNLGYDPAMDNASCRLVTAKCLSPQGLGAVRGWDRISRDKGGQRRTLASH
jgi:hypothetical protein